MKRFTCQLFNLCFLILFFLCLSVTVQAQIGDPSCDPMDPACPIDGGLSALLAIGVGYGIKKVTDARKA